MRLGCDTYNDGIERIFTCSVNSTACSWKVINKGEPFNFLWLIRDKLNSNKEIIE